MAWISVDQKFIGGKLRKLYKAIGCSQNEAIGILIVLWLWGIDNADEKGLIVSADRDDIAEVIRPGLNTSLDADAVVEALVQNGWIDKAGGKLYFHDWSEWRSYYNSYTNSKTKNAERVRRFRQKNTDYEECNVTSNVTCNVTSNVTESKDEPISETAEMVQPPKRKKVGYSTEFEKFWEVYPRHADKGQAYKKYSARQKDGYSPEELYMAAEKYAEQCRIRKTEQEYIKHAKTFLGDATPFVEFIPKNQINQDTPVREESTGNPFRSTQEE